MDKDFHIYTEETKPDPFFKFYKKINGEFNLIRETLPMENKTDADFKEIIQIFSYDKEKECDEKMYKVEVYQKNAKKHTASI